MYKPFVREKHGLRQRETWHSSERNMAFVREKHGLRQRETWHSSERNMAYVREKHSLRQRETWPTSERNMAYVREKHGLRQRETWPSSERNMAYVREKHGLRQRETWPKLETFDYISSTPTFYILIRKINVINITIPTSSLHQSPKYYYSYYLIVYSYSPKSHNFRESFLLIKRFSGLISDEKKKIVLL